MMEANAKMLLGVVVERRRSKSPWQDWSWRPVSVILGAPPLGSEWRELLRDADWTQYHAANLPLELSRSDTAAYILNLSQKPPRIYVVLRSAGAQAAQPYRPLLITASPAEAEGYLSSGDEIVEAVPMPAPVVAWLEAFVARHHVERPFVKRKRKRGAASATEERPGGGMRHGRARIGDDHG
jgi:Protein of unknown function (DUF3305)